MPVLISKINDPCRRVIPQPVPWKKGQRLDGYLDGLLPVHEGLTPVVAVNGRIICAPFDQVVVRDNDRIAVSARMEFEAAAFVGSWLATTLFPASLGIMGSVMGYSIAYGIGFAATMLAMGYGANKLVGLIAPEPGMPGQSSYDQAERTYGWAALGQTLTEGTPILDGYGVNRVSGQVLSQYIDVVDNKEVLYVLLAVLGRQVDALSDFRVNDQPYTYFRGVSIETRLGTLNDAPIDGFSEVPLQKTVKAKLSNAIAVTRTTDGTLVDKLVFIVSAPGGMYYANDSGGLDTRSATFTIEYKKSADAAWTLHDTVTITGATNEAILKKYTINSLDSDQYDMRLTRTSADTAGSRTQTDIYWMYWTEIIKEAFIYPGIAKWAIQAVALEDLSGGKPTFSCLVHVNTVQVYDTSLETPAWVAKSATNPAWMDYDRLVRNGQSTDRILFDEFADFADHNDEDISQPEDPAEKRNVANMIISSGNLWDNVQQIARIGQGAIIYRGSDFGVFIDKEEASVDHLFTMGNILDETFKLEYLDEEDRANCVEIEYTDPDRDYTWQPISVHSQAYLESSAVSKVASVQVNAGVPQKQMVRHGVRLINNNTYLVRVISFEAFLDSFTCTAGDLFYFQHEVVNYDDQNIGGRIADAGNDYRVDILGLPNDPQDMTPWVQLDRTVTIQESIDYKVLVRLADDTQLEKTVLMDPAETDILFLASPWLTLPDPKDVFAFGVVTSGYKKRYRLSDISRSNDAVAALVAIEYIPEIYTQDSSRVINEPTWEQHKQEAIDVMANEILAYAPDGSYISKLNVSWHRSYSDTGASWNVWLEDTTQGTAPVFLDYVHKLQYTVTASLLLGHTYRVIISAGKTGPVLDTGNYDTVTILGKDAPPGDVTTFTGTWDAIKRAVHFVWSAVSDIDLACYEIQEGGIWSDAGPAVKTSIETSCSIFIPEGVVDTRTYRIKAKDRTGNYSDTEAVAIVTIDTADCPLAVPGALTLVSNSSIASDGRNIVTLLATWNGDAELSDDWHHYEVQLEDMAVGKRSTFATTEREYQWELIPNKQYGVAVRAYDRGLNHTSYCTQVLHTTARDTAAPATPTWPSTGFAIPGFKVIGLSWNGNTEKDLKHYVLERSTESDFSSGITVLGDITATMHSDNQGLAVDTEYFYRLKAVDTSENASGYSAIKSATTTQVGATDIAYNSLNANHIDTFDLTAMTAKILGTLKAGIMESPNYSTTEGMFVDLVNTIFKIGGSAAPQLSFDGADLLINAPVTFKSGSSGYANISDAPLTTNPRFEYGLDYWTFQYTTPTLTTGGLWGGSIIECVGRQTAVSVLIPVNASLVYNGKFRVRQSVAGFPGQIYAGLYAYQSDGVTFASTGWSWFIVSELLATGDWTEFSGKIGPGEAAEFSSDTAYIRLVFHLDYLDLGNTMQVDGLEFYEDIAATNGIADGADVTGSNTAAAITGQGSLATKSAVGVSDCDTTIISGGKIVTSLLEAQEIAAGSITTTELAAGAVTAAKIATGTITATQLAANSVNTSELVAGSVDATIVGANQIISSAANIGNLTVSNIKIETNALLNGRKLNVTLVGSVTVGSKSSVGVTHSLSRLPMVTVASYANLVSVSALSISTFTLYNIDDNNARTATYAYM